MCTESMAHRDQSSSRLAPTSSKTRRWSLLARDYETHPHRSAAMIQLAAINLMTRRLTQEATTNWRHS
jgi:hypothetical protein